MISFKQLVEALLWFPAEDVPCAIGQPGCGKSAAINVVNELISGKLVPIYALTRDAIDCRGVPLVEKSHDANLMTWAVPKEFPLQILADRYPSDKPIILFLDDLFQGIPAVQTAFARSFFERCIGEEKLLPNVRVIVAGNRDSDKAATHRIPSWVTDRLTFLEVTPSTEDWIEGAVSGFELPKPLPGYAEKRAAVDKAVSLGIPDWLVAFVKWDKTIVEFDPAKRSNPTPRSVERLGRIDRAFEVAEVDGDIFAECAAGTIGDEHAVKAIAFRRMAKSLPSVDKLLKGEDVKLPSKPEVLLVTAIACLRAATAKHGGAIAKLINRMSEVEKDGYNVGIEPAAFLFQECRKKGGGLQAAVLKDGKKEILNWLKENKDVLPHNR